MINALIVYAVLAFLWGFFWVLRWDTANPPYGDREERRFAARMVLLSPVWPIPGIALIIGLLAAIKDDATSTHDKEAQQ